MEQLKVTSLDDLQSYAKGTVVKFPSFAEGQPLVARVTRPSMLVLAKTGKIPNSLLNAAAHLFKEGGDAFDADNSNMLRDMYNLCHLMAESTLKEPTLADIESAGLNLTDEQMMAIFNYTQQGNDALKSFRSE